MKIDFKIPTKICLEAKQYMKGLLQQLEEHQIGVNGLDHLALEQIAYTYHTWAVARKAVLKEGYILKEKNARNAGVSKPHPAVKIMYDANAQLTKLVQLFGLSPKSRGSIGNLQLHLPMNPALDKFNSNELKAV